MLITELTVDTISLGGRDTARFRAGGPFRPVRAIGIATLGFSLLLFILSCGSKVPQAGENLETTVDVEKYQAYIMAGGPYCGKDSRGQQVFCEPRSVCTSPETTTCEDKLDFYQAFIIAGGPFCGKDSRNQQVFCQPRSTCVDPEANRCKEML